MHVCMYGRTFCLPWLRLTLLAVWGAGFKVLGAEFPQVPLLHLVLDPEPPTNGITEGQVLQDLADKALDLGVLVAVHRISPLDRWQPRPSLRCAARHQRPQSAMSACPDIWQSALPAANSRTRLPGTDGHCHKCMPWQRTVSSTAHCALVHMLAQAFQMRSLTFHAQASDAGSDH